MGYSSGIYLYKLFDNSITYKDLRSVERLLGYEASSWAQEHFKTAEEYAKYQSEESEAEYIPQSEERLNFYRNHLVETDYGDKYIWEEKAYWGSNGSGAIHDFIATKGINPYSNDHNGVTRVLSKQDVVDFFNFCLDHVLSNLPQPCNLRYAYTYERDEDGDVPEDAKITLIPCDGVEIQFDEDKAIKRMDTNDEWDCYLGFPRKYYDEWEESGYIEGVKACANLLATVDWATEMVVFNGSW